MPTSSGKFQLQDYDTALVVRGFDGFQPVERYQMINLGYRYIARKFPYLWESASAVYTVNPGSYAIALQSGNPLTADSVRSVFLTSDPYRRKLEPAKEEYFKRRYLRLDLTLAQNQGIPLRYFLFENQLYILPPPQLSVQITVHFYQYLPDMVAITDVPITPQILDEVILDAALVRCHRRAHELELSAEAQSRVDEAVADMLQDDIWQMEELQERILPDNQWL